MSAKKIGMVSLKSAYLAHREEIDVAYRRVMESGWYILGSEVRQFEASFAAWCGATECIGVGNGTDAIVLALRSLGVGPGDAVFTVSHTAVATVAAIEMTGAVPVLVDVEPEFFTMDPNSLEQAVRSCAQSSAKPRAVVAVHIYGQPCNLAAIQSICETYGLKLIEDCAQAHGAKIEGRKVGNFGVAATFSFYPTKNLGAFGDAGAVVTSDSDLAATCRALREYGWRKRYLSELAGVNSRLDELHAAILSVRLKYLDNEVRARRLAAARYNAALADFVRIPAIRNSCEHAYHLYVVRTKNRDGFRNFLADRGIDTGVHYPQPVHEQAAYRDRVSLAPGGLAVTEGLRDDIVSLPMHAFLDDDDIDSVIQAVADWNSSGG